MVSNQYSVFSGDEEVGELKQKWAEAEETLRLERRRSHRAAARWVDEMSSLEEENVRLRGEITRLQKIEEVAKEYQLTRNINWRLELFRLVKEGG